MCTDARQYAMQQQANMQQPVYHHQQMPPQMPQYQTQPTYQTQPQYVISQAHAAQLQERPRQNAPNESMPPNIYHQQMAGPGLPQNVLYHQQQIQNHYSLQPTMHRSPPTNQSGLPPQGQMHPQSQANIYSQNNAAAIMSGAATLRRPPSNQAREIEPNPNSNLPDNPMFDRDKQQMFKYSTLRQGGKFDPRNFGPRPGIPNGQQVAASPKPAILNCPLPEIPRENASNGKEPNNAVSPRNLIANGAPNASSQPAMTR